MVQVNISANLEVSVVAPCKARSLSQLSTAMRAKSVKAESGFQSQRPKHSLAAMKLR